MNDEKYFQNITTRERSIFEGAITMGALFHQFVGTPVNIKSADSLETAMEESLSLQPCISSVKVQINRELLKETENEYDYLSLTGDMLDVRLVSEYKGVRAVVRMQYIEELQYPLMYVEEVD
ncbi:MAG: dihydroneopterin aldolase family protein [Methanobacteriaceae archaeon]|nr:dihydroneopterin aldolase family protein [Methanobacteriaceae archaeon]